MDLRTFSEHFRGRAIASFCTVAPRSPLTACTLTLTLAHGSCTLYYTVRCAKSVCFSSWVDVFGQHTVAARRHRSRRIVPVAAFVFTHPKP